MIDILHGQIEVESEEGKGTKFTLNFTFGKSQTAIAKDSKQLDSKEVQIKEGKNVLIVEDNPMNQTYMHSIIGKLGLEIDFANNGEIGVELARKKKYDLILMDIRMPEMDGYEAAEFIREHSSPNRQTPIIAISASALEAEKHKALDHGMNDFLSKPFIPGDLTTLLGKYLNQNNNTDVKTDEFKFHDAFDSAQLHEFYEGDMETIQLMFDSFINGVLPEIPELKKHSQEENWQEVQDLAHKFLPTFSMIGLMDLHNALRQIEEDCKAGNTDHAKEEVIKVIREINDLKPVIFKEFKRINDFIASD